MSDDANDRHLESAARAALSLELPADLAQRILARSRPQPAARQAGAWMWIPATATAAVSFVLVSLAFLTTPAPLVEPAPLASATTPVPVVVTFHAGAAGASEPARRLAYTLSAGGGLAERGEIELIHLALDTVDASVLGREPF